jgi:hypothetical protein
MYKLIKNATIYKSFRRFHITLQRVKVFQYQDVILGQAFSTALTTVAGPRESRKRGLVAAAAVQTPVLLSQHQMTYLEIWYATFHPSQFRFRLSRSSFV